jgi:glycerol kinase
MAFVLALDSGTTSARAILFDASGAVRAIAQKELTQHYTRPGWVEHDPLEIWTAQISVAIEALGRAGIGPRDVAAVGITNQRETTIVWDRHTGEPVSNAIVWQDRRTATQCDRLRADGLGDLIRNKTGLVIDAYFSATKIAWMLDNVPGARAKAEAGRLAFGTVDTWLVWKLTEGKLHATDSSNASRTMLFDIHQRDWDDELLNVFKIPRGMLPDVRPSSGVFGSITSALGLGSIPIAGIAGDQQAALFGQLCTSPGLTKNTYGTGCFMLQCTGTTPVASKNNLVTTVAWTIDGRTNYALEGSVFIAGAVVQWLRDGLGLIRNAEDVSALALTVPDNGGVYLVPAFTGLGAPHWDPHARGTIVGISRGTTAGHLARAALEGIAFQSADLLDAMSADAGHPVAELRVDGGAARSDLLMQFQADLLDVPAVRPVVTETTALGAAYLAGLGVGFWKSPTEIAAQRAVERTFEPRMDRARARELRANWQRAVERSRGWANDA